MKNYVTRRDFEMWILRPLLTFHRTDTLSAAIFNLSKSLLHLHSLTAHRRYTPNSLSLLFSSSSFPDIIYRLFVKGLSLFRHILYSPSSATALTCSSATTTTARLIWEIEPSPCTRVVNLFSSCSWFYFLQDRNCRLPVMNSWLSLGVDGWRGGGVTYL